MLASPLIQLLRDQEAQLTRKAAETANRYGDKHPAALGTRSEIADLRQKIGVEIGKIAQSVAGEADVARARAGSLKATIDGLQRAVSGASTADVRLHELEQQAEADRAELAGYLAHATEVSDQALQIRADARLVSPAVEPIQPSSPQTMMVLPLGLGGGLLIGLLIGLWRDRTDDTARGLRQLEAMVGVPCLGLLPRLRWSRKGSKSAPQEVIERPGSPFSEGVRSIVATLEASAGSALPRIVLVTSALPGAGKTLFSSSLARTAAKAGHKVLLIDCNLRQPAVGGMLQCADRDGLDAVIMGRELSQSPIQTDAASGLHILPTHVSPRIHELLSSPALAALIDEARRHYDLVVLDGPALVQGPDALILSRFADLGLVLVPWRRTRLNALLRAMHRFSMPPGKQLATLLSEVPVERYERYLLGRVM